MKMTANKKAQLHARENNCSRLFAKFSIPFAPISPGYAMIMKIT